MYVGNITPNFTWEEATKGGTRLPPNQEIEQRIVRMANALEEVRSLFGDKPIAITSWYRPPSVNRSVGGAKYSRHLHGDAVDFTVQGVAPLEVYARLDPWWGNRGGLGKHCAFTHIDLRGNKARWDY